jgi:fucose permease
MASLLIAIIYISFISLGLPDSLLGSAWPVMQIEFGAPLSAAGGISLIITAGTIISSLLSERIIRKFGAGIVNAASCALTALALLGFSYSNSVLMLCILAVPYGLGAGAIDVALNNYVALHFSARHMSWLHCFWGLGASISPYIMTYCLSSQHGWQTGYRSVSVIQLVLTVFLFLSLPLWRKLEVSDATTEDTSAPSMGLLRAMKLRGLPLVLLALLSYCAVECTLGLWASSYLVEFRGVDTETAASFASLFFIGITVGRFLNGILASRFSDKTLIRVGIVILSVGILFIMLPVKFDGLALAGLLITGFGCAPVFPCIMHSTPERFGKENSQSVVGMQMAGAYVGMAVMPPAFGFIATHIHIGIYPFFVTAFIILLILTTERLNRMFAEQK